MHLLTKILSFHSLRETRADPPASIDFGYWDLTLSGGSSSSGYVWHDVYSTYSGTPNARPTALTRKGPPRVRPATQFATKWLPMS